MSSDWWAKKLGGAQAPPTPGYPGTQAPSVPSYPGGPAAPQYAPPVPQGQQPQVTKENIAEVAGLWKGGKGTQTETTTCPNCGGDYYMSQSHTPPGGAAGGAGARIATERGMANVSPRCFSCGYSLARPLQTGSM